MISLTRAYALAAAAFLTLATALLPHLANAQSAGLQPPTVDARDQNGVDLITGQFGASLPGMSAGGGGSGISRSISGYNLPYGDNFSATLNGGADPSGATYILISIGGQSEKMYGPASATSSATQVIYSPEVAGNTFVCASYICTYTMADGSVAIFNQSSTYTSNVGIRAGLGAMTSLTKSDGEVLTLNYKQYVSSTVIPGIGPAIVLALRSVSSSMGWMIKYDMGTNASDVNPTKMYIVNTSIDYCSPTADGGCTSANSGSWQTMTPVTGGWSYALHSSTDPDPVYTVTTGSSGSPISTNYLTGVTSPQGVSIAATFTSGSVSSLTKAGQTWSYGYGTVGTTKTTTVTDAASHTRVVTSDTATSHILSSQDEFGRVTRYNYYAATNASTGALKNKVSQVLDPDFTGTVSSPTGGYTEYRYDDRGNITRISKYPKGGGTPIVTSATYLATGTCTDPRTCNKPLTTTDANGIVTTYTYDPSSGQVATVTLPAVGGISPQTRYTYTQVTPQVKNSSGTLVNSTPVWRLWKVSACMSTNSCSGTADEQLTTYGYSTVNGALTSTTVQIGNANLASAPTQTNVWNTMTMSYDYNGNVIATDGPKSGTADTVYSFYDGMNRPIGEIGIDPDSAGSRPRPAKRTHYTADGKVDKVESGTATGTNLAAVNAITVAQSQVTQYDSQGRVFTTAVYPGGSGTPSNLTQYSYDSMKRLDCVAVRLNPADYSSLPGSACALGSTLPDGTHDRISKNSYDSTGQLLSTITGYGVAGVARTEVTKVYDTGSATSTGTLTSVADAKGNKTAFEYDAFNRTSKTCFATASNGVLTNGADCSQVVYGNTYTVGGYTAEFARPSATVLRSDPANPTAVTAATQSLSYDPAGRLYSSTGSIWRTATFNNFNKAVTKTSYTTGGATAYETYTYNAAGVLLSDAQTNGTVTYDYDGYGKRTQLNYPGSFSVSYTYTDGDELQTISQGGVTLATFGYDTLGRRSTLTYGSGYTTTSGYDTKLRLQTITMAASGGTADTITLGYNNADQINSRAHSNGAFDFTPTAQSTTYGINGLNQIGTVTDGSTTSLTYDVRGNLTADVGGTYVYNNNNLLTSATQSGVTSSLVYDAENRLTSISKNGTTTKFLYDGTDIIAEYDGSGNLLRRFVHGPGSDEPLVWFQNFGTHSYRYLLSDERGSIIGTTDPSGVVQSTYTYNEYGLSTASNNSPFQYTGQLYLPEIGMYYYKARLYNPIFGRFMQTDPVGYRDGINWYAYVGNDPTNRADPSGLTMTYTSPGSPGCINVTQYNTDGPGYLVGGMITVHQTINSFEACGADRNQYIFQQPQEDRIFSNIWSVLFSDPKTGGDTCNATSSNPKTNDVPNDRGGTTRIPTSQPRTAVAFDGQGANGGAGLGRHVAGGTFKYYAQDGAIYSGKWVSGGDAAGGTGVSLGVTLYGESPSTNQFFGDTVTLTLPESRAFSGSFGVNGGGVSFGQNLGVSRGKSLFLEFNNTRLVGSLKKEGCWH